MEGNGFFFFSLPSFFPFGFPKADPETSTRRPSHGWDLQRYPLGGTMHPPSPARPGPFLQRSVVFLFFFFFAIGNDSREMN